MSEGKEPLSEKDVESVIGENAEHVRQLGGFPDDMSLEETAAYLVVNPKARKKLGGIKAVGLWFWKKILGLDKLEK